jgi:hypothetical protein
VIPRNSVDLCFIRDLIMPAYPRAADSLLSTPSISPGAGFDGGFVALYQYVRRRRNHADAKTTDIELDTWRAEPRIARPSIGAVDHTVISMFQSPRPATSRHNRSHNPVRPVFNDTMLFRCPFNWLNKIPAQSGRGHTSTSLSK